MILFPSLLHLLLPFLLTSLALCFYVPSSNVLSSFGDQVRQRHLYTENKRQAMFLEMRPDGSIASSPLMSQYTALALRSVKAGHTVIKGLASSLFLCVDQRGHFKGEHAYTATDCNLEEVLLADGYSMFLSPHTGLPLSLKRRGGQMFSHFLPLASDQPQERQEAQEQGDVGSRSHHATNLESDDPYELTQSHSHAVFSPSMDMRK